MQPPRDHRQSTLSLPSPTRSPSPLSSPSAIARASVPYSDPYPSDLFYGTFLGGSSYEDGLWHRRGRRGAAYVTG